MKIYFLRKVIQIQRMRGVECNDDAIKKKKERRYSEKQIEEIHKNRKKKKAISLYSLAQISVEIL